VRGLRRPSIRRLECAPHVDHHLNFWQAHALSNLSSPTRKRRKSGSGGPGPTASQPGIEMFMRQAPTHPAASGAAACHDDVEAISDDDDAPMVVAGGLNAARAAVSPLPARHKAGGSAAPRSSCSVSSDAAVQAQAFAGSKRPAAAAESVRGAQAGIISREDSTAAAARAGAAVDVVGNQEAGDVLDIDDLDSLFCL
jgi:hypothetical protein